MKIRQYTAPTMQEAILKIKVDLGPNAVILHTRKFKRGGFMGFFSQDMVEVLAAIDPNEARDKEAARAGARERENGRGRGEDRRERREAPEVELGPMASMRAEAPKARDRDDAVTWEPSPAARRGEAWPEEERRQAPEREAIAEKTVAVATEIRPQPAAEPAPEPVVAASATPLVPEANPLADEVQDLKSTVHDLKEMLGVIVGQLETQPRDKAQFPPLLQKVFDRLVACDVEPSIARGLVVYLQREQPHLESYDELVAALEKPLSGLIQSCGPVTATKGQQKIVALVGPTGVGKTTTIAKLAASHALARNVEMALLTIDTYRVAAIEQLKTYGDIIGLPVEVVLTPQGMKDALKLHHAKDLILIDTAGRSPYNKMHLNELRGFLDLQLQRETHLVLSSTTRLGDLRRIVKNFAATGVDRLIFTKTDETDVVGGIISIAHETGLPVSYITTGQSVPDDIMVADGAQLARMLITELKA